MYLLRSDWYKYVNLTVLDVILAVLLFTAISIWAYIYTNKKKGKDSYYRFFATGLMVRIVAVILFCLVYMIFYTGDTLDYFNSAVTLNHVFLDNPGHYFSIIFGGNKSDYYFFFNSTTGFPEWHMWKDPMSFFVVRLISPICWFGLNSFLLSSIIMAFISYSGLWKMFRLLCTLYPKLDKYFAFSVLMVPSVLFWGSGLLKDTITMAAAAWLTYCIFSIFFIKRKVLTNIFVALFMSYMLLEIKPYIFISLIPGLIIWLSVKWIKQIKNILVRILLIPTLFGIVIAAMVLAFSGLGEFLGVYGSLDTMVNKVKITQADLKRSEQYGSNYFDLGQIEPTSQGLILKAPAAIIAGLFRPFIWEARNPFVLLSSLENLFLLFMVIFILIKTGIKVYFTSLFKDPFLTFSFLFSVFFAYGIGMAAANFGALVRYKIPLLPFFVSGMFIMLDIANTYKKKKNGSLDLLDDSSVKDPDNEEAGITPSGL